MTLSDAFDALDAHYARTLDRLNQPDALRVAPNSEAWGEAQHVWHTDAVARGSLGAIRRIERGGDEASMHPKALEVLERGVLPRGFKAPEAFVPPADVDLDALRRDLSKRRAAFAALAADPAPLQALSGTFPHPRFGPLDAVSWVRFTALHTAHHERLIDEIG